MLYDLAIPLLKKLSCACTCRHLQGCVSHLVHCNKTETTQMLIKRRMGINGAILTQWNTTQQSQ